MELYKGYRPDSLQMVLGQNHIGQVINKWKLKGLFPHSILLTGPSGTGKTTIARILAGELTNLDSQDYSELNCSNFRGIDFIRDLINQAQMKGLTTHSRVWVIDECHRLTPDAQDAMLKLLEDTPRHAYFILLTTEPQKLIKPLRDRCTSLQTRAIDSKDIESLVKRVAKSEKIKLSEDMLEAIVASAAGSARVALVNLELAANCEDEESVKFNTKQPSAPAEVLDLCRLLFGGKGSWGDCLKILRTIKEEPEAVRWSVLGYANAIIYSGKGNTVRAIQVIEAFRDNYYDCKASGLIYSCYEIMGTSK